MSQFDFENIAKQLNLYSEERLPQSAMRPGDIVVYQPKYAGGAAHIGLLVDDENGHVRVDGDLVGTFNEDGVTINFQYVAWIHGVTTRPVHLVPENGIGNYIFRVAASRLHEFFGKVISTDSKNGTKFKGEFYSYSNRDGVITLGTDQGEIYLGADTQVTIW